MALALTAAVPAAAHVGGSLDGLSAPPGATTTLALLWRHGALVRLTVPEDLASGASKRLVVTNGDRPCPVRVLERRRLPRAGALQLDLAFSCAGRLTVLNLEDRGFSGHGTGSGDVAAPGNQVLIAAGTETLHGRLTPAALRVTVPVAQLMWEAGTVLPERVQLSSPPLNASRGYFALGFLHVVTGYDHLAFVAALVLLAPTFRRIAWLVSGFTVAHSLSLAAAASGWLVPPVLLTEIAIAVSVAYVGVENVLLLWRRAERRVDFGRWWLTCGFGLIHGFGFSFLLNDAGLPPEGALEALLLFNLGVEAGQLSACALPLALLSWAMRRTPVWRPVSLAGSAAVAGLGIAWIGVRLS